MELSVNLRIRAVNDAPVRADGTFVLYWMIATRRASWNFALDRAVDWAQSLGQPLVVMEALRCGYTWASDRLHRFVLEGMRDNAAAFSQGPALYFPYVEAEVGAGKGLLESLARSASVVVTDDYPCFFLPRMVETAGTRLGVRLEAVDSNGILPMRAADKPYPAAVHYRRHLQKHIKTFIREFPQEEPFLDKTLPRLRALPAEIARRWPAADVEQLAGSVEAVRRLPIDHSVPIVAMTGGSRAAEQALERFLGVVGQYHDGHNHPDESGTSRLSPYLHFGHISTHEVFTRVVRRERWSVSKLGTVSGAREGFWGASPGTEAFLDQLLTWRELGFNTCCFRPGDYDAFSSLPGWAQDTLHAHASDPRTFIYSQDEFEEARTHDPLWNAAQRQLREEGWMHNYLRMLWGKKILEWSRTPEEALSTMKNVMDRWAVDGRDPNSYAGYCWTLGRYDRPWPERSIYGTVRSMSSENTRKKVHVERLLREYGDDRPGGRPHQGRLLAE